MHWDEQYQASTAAAGPAKWRLRSAFLTGTYASLQRTVQERRSAEERTRAAEVDRRHREVIRKFLHCCEGVLGNNRTSCDVACPLEMHDMPWLGWYL